MLFFCEIALCSTWGELSWIIITTRHFQWTDYQISLPSLHRVADDVGCGMNLLQVHISLLSDDYVEDPFEVVKVGDEAPGPWRCRTIKR